MIDTTLFGTILSNPFLLAGLDLRNEKHVKEVNEKKCLVKHILVNVYAHKILVPNNAQGNILINLSFLRKLGHTKGKAVTSNMFII